MIREIYTDLRSAARSLAKAPRYTVIAGLTLSLGVAATTAVFSVVNGVLLRPLDFPNADRLVNLRSSAPGLGYDRFPLSPDLHFEYAKETSLFEDNAIYQSTTASLTGEGEPERVPGVVASRTLFSTLGVEPLLGRVQSADEDLPDATKVVVLGHGVWERHYGGDPTVIGRATQVDGESREVIGVMPRGFEYPDESEVWLPLGIDPESPITGQFGWNSIARLKPEVTTEMVRARLTDVIARFKETLAASEDGAMYVAFLNSGSYVPIVGFMTEDLVGSMQRPLWILLGTVGFVLLIACANVANLVLIRAEGRRRETAVRVAMGATRASLARQQLAESAVLAGVGGALGVLLAWIGVPLVLSQAPPELPRLAEVGVDGSVLLFALAATALSAALFGAAPLIRHTGSHNLDDLRQGGRGNTAGRERLRGRNLLVVAQTSLALVLLVGSGLLVRSFQKVADTDLGFEYEDRLTLGVALPESRYPTATEVAAAHERIRERLSAVPGVISVGVVSHLPISQSASGTAHEIEGRTPAAGELPPILHYEYASADYLETMGIDVVSGRTLNEADHLDRAGSVVVNRTLAERVWPGEDALGKRLRPSGDTVNWYTVVGVVEPVLQDGIRAEPQARIYHPLVGPRGDDGYNARLASYVVRARGAETLLPSVRAAIWEVDPDLPLSDVRTMADIVSSSVVELSFTMFTLGIAAALALALGGIGLYGVLSYAVARRIQEIGVRMALGARSGEVLAMVVWDGVRVAALGLVVGGAGAAALTRLLQGILFGVEALDPLTFAVTSMVLMAVATLAAYLPARRASRVDPAGSMRME